MAASSSVVGPLRRVRASRLLLTFFAASVLAPIAHADDFEECRQDHQQEVSQIDAAYSSFENQCDKPYGTQTVFEQQVCSDLINEISIFSMEVQDRYDNCMHAAWSDCQDGCSWLGEPLLIGPGGLPIVNPAYFACVLYCDSQRD
jgi:hypothetical protein